MFRLLNKVTQLFFAPDDGPGNTPPSGKEDIIEFLGAEDEPEVLDIHTRKIGDKNETSKASQPPAKDNDDDASEDKVDDEDESDELTELEEELKGPTEEQLELVTPVRRKEILAKFPTLFKEFPYLEKAYYREQQFTELLPTIQDAKTAVEKAQTLDQFEKEIMGGTTENILKSVKETDPNSFYKIVDEYLPTLAKVDEQAYYHVISNMTKHTITAMVMEARKSNNEALQSAASILNQFVFGSTDFKPPQNLARQDSQQDQQQNTQVNQREQAFLRQSFDTTHGDLNTKVNNTLRNTIDANIDPHKSMSDYVRRNASKDALESLDSLISRDTRFKALTDKLWERAFETNFSKDSTDKIRSAFLSKAKTLLPAVIKKARNEALRGTGRRNADDQDDEKTSANKGPITAGRPRSTESSGKIKEAKDIPKKMSTLDFLNS